MGVAHTDVYFDTLADTLGNDAEVLELGEHAIQVLIMLFALGQEEFRRHSRNAPASLGIARQACADFRVQPARLVAVLAQREQQAGAEAMGDAGEEHARGIGTARAPERRAMTKPLPSSRVGS